MTKRNMTPIHPGEILLEEFLIPMDISQYKLAKELYMSPIRISEIIRGKRSVTADAAIRLGRYFKMEAKFWMNLQAAYDLEVAIMESSHDIYKKIHPRKHAA
ncbi:MAG: XRE family plasmid maintenance system antidote protein [uncultured bacterium]|nr:MAG: XRE family plasmid maintenance system antidote protein [uncultured bacterium]OGT46441.1 MAG: addiction module antidote protein, HigA family [Gammaproteobacteria bacterium RIFCSPHIGHO2_12_FULL_38_11]